MIQRARDRRAPRRWAMGSAAVLTLAGLAVFTVTAMPGLLSPPLGASDAALSPAASSAGAHAQEEAAAAECPPPPAAATPNAWGLVLSESFPASAPTEGRRIPGMLTLTNTGTAPVHGHISGPVAVTLSQDGATMGYGTAEIEPPAGTLHLAPGDSVSLPVSLLAAGCAPVQQSPRSQHPLPAGTFLATAAISFVPEGSGGTITVTGPGSRLVLE